MVTSIECVTGMVTVIDVSNSYIGQQERWWFEILATRGSDVGCDLLPALFDQPMLENFNQGFAIRQGELLRGV